MKIHIFLVLVLLTLTACLSSDVSRSSAFRAHRAKDLKTQRITFIYPDEYMKSILWGGWVPIYYMEDSAGGRENVISIPIGTPVRIRKIERRNLIDHGVETLAFGVLRRPDTGVEVEFIFDLSSDMGRTVPKAPWEK